MGFEFNSIEEIAADLAAGKPVVMLDNEDRERGRCDLCSRICHHRECQLHGKVGERSHMHAYGCVVC